MQGRPSSSLPSPHSDLAPSSPLRESLNVTELLQVFKRLAQYSRLVLGLYRSPGISKAQKALLFIAIGYTVSPVDLIPGFIPVAGQLDDMLVALGIISAVISSLPEDVSQPLLQQAGLNRATLDGDLRACQRAAAIMARKSADLISRATRLGFKAASGAFHGARRVADRLKKR